MHSYVIIYVDMRLIIRLHLKQIKLYVDDLEHI